MDIHGAGEWGSSASKNTQSFNPTGLILHHTVTENRKPAREQCAELVRTWELMRSMQRYHVQTLGWVDIGYNFVVSIGGVIVEARRGSLRAAQRGKLTRGAHAGTRKLNEQNWGVAVEGNTDEYEMSPEQLDSLCELCAHLCFWGDVDTAVIKGHRDIRNTICPGKFLYSTLNIIRKRAHDMKVIMINAATSSCPKAV